MEDGGPAGPAELRQVASGALTIISPLWGGPRRGNGHGAPNVHLSGWCGRHGRYCGSSGSGTSAAPGYQNSTSARLAGGVKECDATDPSRCQISQRRWGESGLARPRVSASDGFQRGVRSPAPAKSISGKGVMSSPCPVGRSAGAPSGPGDLGAVGCCRKPGRPWVRPRVPVRLS